jgi:hypothetical protein
MVHPVCNVGLDRRRLTNSHLLHRLQDLDRGEERECGGDLGRSHPGDEPRDLRSRHGGIDDHPSELNRVERHRLLRDGEVDPVPRDELVEDVEIRLGPPVQLDDPPVLDAERGLGIERARESDEAECRVLGHEGVPADRPRGEVGGAA